MSGHQERGILEKMKTEYEKTEVPKEGLARMERAIREVRMEKRRKKQRRVFRNIGLGAAAAFACVVVLANSTAGISMAMEKIPVLGTVVKAVTFREFEVNKGNYQADVKVPQLTAEDESGSPELQEQIDRVNADIQEYTDAFIRDFEKDLAENGGEGHESLDISYEVVRDDDSLYTIRVSALQIMGSGAQSVRYYHLDKKNGAELSLEQLFRPEADYVTLISENIKEQMREQMASDEGKAYFLDSEDMPEFDFAAIRPDQNFYISQEGKLTIAFDEYEVAPGYMGAVEFTIPTEILADSLNPGMELVK